MGIAECLDSAQLPLFWRWAWGSGTYGGLLGFILVKGLPQHIKSVH